MLLDYTTETSLRSIGGKRMKQKQAGGFPPARKRMILFFISSFRS
jgi:hypothetical protein